MTTSECRTRPKTADDLGGHSAPRGRADVRWVYRVTFLRSYFSIMGREASEAAPPFSGRAASPPSLSRSVVGERVGRGAARVDRLAAYIALISREVARDGGIGSSAVASDRFPTCEGENHS